MKTQAVRRRRKILRVAKNCSFCKEKKEPWLADTQVLRRFLTERGKIIARSRNGLCAKHQRILTLSIKHARHLALLPFTPHQSTP